jgi:hypothetical protein
MTSFPPDASPIKPDTVPVKVPGLPRPVTIRYLGFECTSEGRSYRMRVDRGTDDPRLYTVSVPSEAFESRRARFQDAAEMCLQRLQRELDENAELPAGSTLLITTDDLEHYRESQQRRSPARKTRAPHTER